MKSILLVIALLLSVSSFGQDYTQAQKDSIVDANLLEMKIQKLTLQAELGEMNPINYYKALIRLNVSEERSAKLLSKVNEYRTI